MRQPLKAILLNQYIGAISIGLLIYRAVEAFIGAFMPAFNAVLTQLLTGTSLGREYWNSTVRAAVVSNLVLTALYLLAAYMLVIWLYSKQIPEDAPES